MEKRFEGLAIQGGQRRDPQELKQIGHTKTDRNTPDVLARPKQTRSRTRANYDFDLASDTPLSLNYKGLNADGTVNSDGELTLVRRVATGDAEPVTHPKTRWRRRL